MVMEEQQSNMELDSEKIPVPLIQRPPTENALTETNNKTIGISRGKPRLRKKALHAAILKQMEFYFGDANLSKDRFLANLIQQDPYVDLSIFIRFNKIRDLTTDVNRIAKALRMSSMLTVSKDGAKVCRVTPIKEKNNVDECTIYVQNLPPDANHEWLSTLFSQYGSVVYVSIPRYKSNKKIKGFGFVEFDNAEDAIQCIQIFQKKGCLLPSHTSPDQLLSITTFDGNEKDVSASVDLDPENLSDIEGDFEEHSDNGIETKLKRERGGKDYEYGRAQKRRRKDMTTDNYEKVILQSVVEGQESEEKEDDNGNDRETLFESQAPDNAMEKDDDKRTVEGEEDEEEEEEEEEGEEGEKKKKKKRKRKRSRRIEDINCNVGLQVMAKRDWKYLRNRYLELQRSKMKQLKQHLRKTRWHQWSSTDRNKHDREDTEEREKSSKTENVIRNFSFISGVIVKVEMCEPCSDPKGFKMELRGNSLVKYVDITEGSTRAYIRCDTKDTALSIAQRFNTDGRYTAILHGKEEEAYWDKILRDREEKLSKKVPAKQRGRNKLLKKAEKELGKHIKFDEV